MYIAAFVYDLEVAFYEFTALPYSGEMEVVVGSETGPIYAFPY